MVDEAALSDGSVPAPTRRTSLLSTASLQGRRVHKSTTFDVFVGVGLVTYGIVHLLIAWIGVRIFVTGGHGNDSQDAALSAMAATVYGEVLLWITAVGLAALALWQIFETIWRRAPEEGRINKSFGRVGSSFSAIAYVALCFSVVRIAAIGHATRNGRRTEDVSTEFETDVLRVVFFIVGVVFVVLAVRSIYRGLRRRFGDDLKEGVNRKVLVLGQAGFIGKGITFAIVGVMMVITVLDGRTGTPGLESVLRLLNLSPAGGFFLLLKAFGLGLFGVYCFAWAANRRR